MQREPGARVDIVTDTAISSYTRVCMAERGHREDADSASAQLSYLLIFRLGRCSLLMVTKHS
jgi:hypothetical protein